MRQIQYVFTVGKDTDLMHVAVHASFQPMAPSWEAQCVFLGPIPLEGGRSPHPETHQHLQSDRHGPWLCRQHH